MNKKNIIIIIISIILVSVIIGICCFMISKNQSKTGTEWGDYYLDSLYASSTSITSTYTDENGEQKTIEEDYFADSQNAKVGFIQVKEDTIPIMIVSYDKNNQNNIFIQSAMEKDISEKLKYTSTVNLFPNEYDETDSENNYDIRLLYNLEEQKYMWYIHKIDTKSSRESFVPLTTYLMQSEEKNSSNTGKSYYFSEDEMKMNQVSEDGVPVVSKFEEIFIVVDNIENVSIDIGNIHNINENELKKSIKTAVTDYKDIKEIITSEVKTTTENRIKEIEEKQEQIKVAKEEKAQKEAEEKAKAEEAKKKAEEESKNGINVGGSIVKYGTYKGIYGAQGDTLIINVDGTATLKSSNITETYVYSVGNNNFSQDNRQDHTRAALILKKAGASSADSYTFYVGDDGNLWDDPMCYTYVGN